MREERREREVRETIFPHPLVHFQNGCNVQGRARLKPEAPSRLSAGIQPHGPGRFLLFSQAINGKLGQKQSDQDINWPSIACCRDNGSLIYTTGQVLLSHFKCLSLFKGTTFGILLIFLFFCNQPFEGNFFKVARMLCSYQNSQLSCMHTRIHTVAILIQNSVLYILDGILKWTSQVVEFEFVFTVIKIIFLNN